MKPLEINPEVLEKTVKRCRERGIIIPTFAQQRDPELIPPKIQEKLPSIGLWDVHPLNLFRITWKNDIKTGLFNGVNFIELPSSLTGVKARIVGLIGKYFPTGAHKVGAAFGCLVPRLVTGQFDPTSQKAVWPSTGNYCRGGAFDCALLACDAIAILPEEMSRERFDWLREIGTKEIIATPGSESNVKEIYDKCWELKRERGNQIVIFNQFDEFGNCIWHYEITGPAIEEVFEKLKSPRSRFAAYVSATGSAGTIGAGDYLRKKFPLLKVGASEALQCPTLFLNGFGAHRIEGIGDKHVPWIHNVRNTDVVIAIDDEYPMRLLRLFNEEKGKELLIKEGVPEHVVASLPLLGISSISNLISSIKLARFFELDERDIVFTIFTDSAEMYLSRIKELREERGEYSERDALVDFHHFLQGIKTDWIKELGYWDRKALHNLKYFTWVEQQGKTVEELNHLWSPDFWEEVFSQVPEWDRLITEFNSRTGLI
ncbi:MAG: pyridoxal-phosphate dependent enzyme [Caldiserica bacterium]|nr:pyridoxal-phosphate dependent enzyme [Caldisericota bacterium]MDH7562493.1 pyridoxal-phosphate dependent enzyme [Caldisericota bacterium]